MEENKSNGAKWFIITILILGFIVFVYIYKNQIFAFIKTKNSQPKQETKKPSPKSTTTQTNETILNKGDTGEFVKKLQWLLNESLDNTFEKLNEILPTSCSTSIDETGHLKIDGIFGECTETMLKHFTGYINISCKHYEDNYSPVNIDLSNNNSNDDSNFIFDFLFGN